MALFAKSAVRAAAGTAISRVTGPRLLATAKAYGELVSWKEVDPVFAEGTRATVQDLYTGYTYEVIRTGGQHHACLLYTSGAGKRGMIDRGGKHRYNRTRPLLRKRALQDRNRYEKCLNLK